MEFTKLLILDFQKTDTSFNFPDKTFCQNGLCEMYDPFLRLTKKLYFAQILSQFGLGGHLRWVKLWHERANGSNIQLDVLTSFLRQEFTDKTILYAQYLNEEDQFAGHNSTEVIEQSHSQVVHLMRLSEVIFRASDSEVETALVLEARRGSLPFHRNIREKRNM